MAIHSSILAWRIPWTVEPGGLHNTGSQRVGHTERFYSLNKQTVTHDNVSPHTCQKGYHKKQVLVSISEDVEKTFVQGATSVCTFGSSAWELPGSPVVRTQRFHCLGPVSVTGGELRSQAPRLV